MENLVEIKNNTIVVSSKNVAEHFGKLHKDILENIRQILVAENSATKFYHEVTFENRGKQYPMYLMNRDGFSLLVMGFTGSEALKWKIKYIEAFNDMENKLKNHTVTRKELTDVSSKVKLINGKFQIREYPKWNGEPRVNVNNAEFKQTLEKARDIISALDLLLDGWEHNYSYCSRFESKFEAVQQLAGKLDNTIINIMDIKFDVYSDEEFQLLRQGLR